MYLTGPYKIGCPNSRGPYLVNLTVNIDEQYNAFGASVLYQSYKSN